MRLSALCMMAGGYANVDANNKKAARPMQVAMSVANRQKAIRNKN